MADAKRDENYIPTLLAVSSADGTTPVTLWADPTTHRLLVDIPSGAGDVTGPASSTDNAIVRFDGTTGKLLQNSGVLISDTNNITGVGSLTATTLTDGTASLSGGALTGLTTALTVAQGGSGRASHTAYAVLVGGTTTTAAQQSIASVGTAGQVLTSNGAGALPTMQDASGGVGGSTGATDNRILRSDGTGGSTLQASAASLDDSGNISGLGTVNSLTLPASNFVGLTDSQTLTNKTLTAPIIATISNTGTLTLPTSTDTLVGKATTDTFTNKTFDANGTGNSISNIDWVNDTITGTDGEIPTYDASGNPAMIAAGTATHVLTSNGAGAAPTFQAAGGGGGAWTLVSYSTATAESITVSGLDLTTDNNHYHIIVDMNFSTVSERANLRCQINAVTTADTYGTVSNGRSIDFSAGTGTARTQNLLAAQWQFGSMGSNSAHLTMDLFASESDAGANLVAGTFQFAGMWQDISQPDFSNYEGAVMQTSATNVTSIKFLHDGAENKIWRVWILKPAIA